MPGAPGWMRWGGRNTAPTFSPFSSSSCMWQGKGMCRRGGHFQSPTYSQQLFLSLAKSRAAPEGVGSKARIHAAGKWWSKRLKRAELVGKKKKKSIQTHPFCSSACKPSREKPRCLCPPVPSDVSSRTLGVHGARCEGLSFFPCPQPPVVFGQHFWVPHRSKLTSPQLGANSMLCA